MRGRSDADRPLRVLHAIHDVAGVAGALAAAERSIGLDSYSVVLRRGPFSYPVDEVLCEPDAGPIAQELARWRTLARAMRHFDVIHCNWGQGLLPIWMGARDDGPFATLAPGVRRAANGYIRAMSLRDLGALKAMGKVVAMTYQGSDARQGDWSRVNQAIGFADEVDDGFYTPSSDEAKRRGIATVDRWADLVYAHNPDIMHVLPPRTTFRPYATVDVDAIRPTPLPENDVPVVVHAPTNRAIKGTRHVVAAVETLRAEGIEIDLRLVEGLPFTDALAAFARCDVFVDQMLLGWYGGGAAQVMAMGRPVITYIRPDDLRFVPPEMRDALPVVRADPTSLADTLRSLLSSPVEHRRRLASSGRAFVERWHDPKRIAAGLAEDYARVSGSSSLRRTRRAKPGSSALS